MRALILMAVYWGALPIILFTDPFYGVLEYTFINIIRPEQLLWSGSFDVGRIFLAVQAVCFISYLINKQKLWPEATPIPRQIFLILIFSLTMVVSSIVGIGPAEPNEKWIPAMLKITLFCFVMSQSINTAKKLEWYGTASIVWFTLLGIWGILQRIGGNETLEGLGGEQLGNRNDLAAVFVLYFPMAYYSISSSKKWIALTVGIPTTILMAMFIIFSGSRGGFLGLAICIPYIFLSTPGFFRKMKMIATAVLIVLLFAAVVIPLAPEGFFEEYAARLETIKGEENEDTGEIEYEDSAAGRTAMWKAVYHFMRQHPEFWFAGLGARGFQAIYFNNIDEIAPFLNFDELRLVLYGGSGGKAIHNTYLNVFTSGGLLGFLPWMYLLYFSWAQARSIPKKYPKVIDGVNIHNYARAIEVGLVGFSVCSLLGNREYIDFYYWYVVLAGIIVNLGNVQLQRNELTGGDEDAEEDVDVNTIAS